MSRERYNSYLINVENHSGTHVDAPGHFLDGGKIISDYSPDELVFNNPLILDCPKKPGELIKLGEIFGRDLEGRDCIIFRTGFGKYRNDDPDTYLTFNPGIASDIIYWLRKNYKNIGCIGIDSVSISSYQKRKDGVKVHLNAFEENENFGEPLLLIEDMKLGDIKNKSSIETIMIVPWQIKGIDSAPCVVLAKIK
ncbi:MAG: cyclase family protein [Euryarchaeota archaeon]|nr:cyclase family protein [Euryarchaeota archaeon]MBV1755194.1 cyclase family protein [Methanobacterium sp.]